MIKPTLASKVTNNTLRSTVENLRTSKSASLIQAIFNSNPPFDSVLEKWPSYGIHVFLFISITFICIMKLSFPKN